MHKTELLSNPDLSDVVYIGHGGFRMGGERATPHEMNDIATAPLGSGGVSVPLPGPGPGPGLQRTQVMQPTPQHLDEWQVPRAWAWLPSRPFWAGLIAGALAVMLFASIGRWKLARYGQVDGEGSAALSGAERAAAALAAIPERAPTPALQARGESARAAAEPPAKDPDDDADDADPAFLRTRRPASAPVVEAQAQARQAEPGKGEPKPAPAVESGRRTKRSAGAKVTAATRRIGSDVGVSAPPSTALQAAPAPAPEAKPAAAAAGWVDPWAD
jgi:hypothetical protein